MKNPALAAVFTALATIAQHDSIDNCQPEFDIVYKFVNTYVNVRAESAAASIPPGHFIVSILRMLNVAMGHFDTNEQVVESWFQSDN